MAPDGGGVGRLKWTLDPAAVGRERARISARWHASRPSIMRFFKPEPVAEVPTIAGIPPAEQFALSAEALEAGQAVLQHPPNVVVEKRRGVLRRHQLKSVLIGVVLVGGWFVLL